MLGAAASALALSGCDGGATSLAPPPTGAEAPLVTPTGMSMQGMSMQGMSLQGMSMQGMSMQGMSLQGMSMQGMSMQGMSLQGTSLQGTDLSGAPVTIQAGAVLTTTDASGAPVTLRIARVQADWQDRSGETLLYAIEGKDAAGVWQNVCAPDQWGEQWAIPVSGHWDATGARINDPGRLTFSCTTGVIAKCVRWGYKPWKTVDGKSLADTHQACTRMARADYCGTGVSHTRNGTLIDMYDPLCVQLPTPPEALVGTGLELLFEASWTPDGAYCVSKQRYQGVDPSGESTVTVLQRECPAKLSPPAQEDLTAVDSCGAKLTTSGRDAIRISNRSARNILAKISTSIDGAASSAGTTRAR